MEIFERFNSGIEEIAIQGENNTFILLFDGKIAGMWRGDDEHFPADIFEGTKKQTFFPEGVRPYFTVEFDSFEEKQKFLNEFENSDVKIEDFGCTRRLKISTPVIHRLVWVYKEMIKFFEE